MDSKDEEKLSEKSDPKINASNKEERIQARRLRIQRRIEAAKKRLVTASEDGGETAYEEEKSLLEKQVETSTLALLSLLEEGKEQVSNVQVAGESYEVKRRSDEASAKEIRLKKLEEEAALALVKFEEISSKWEVIATYNDPLDLHQETETQKEKCMELINQKDKLIEELKAELKTADVRFMKDQIKQSEDITLLVERIDSLVKIMKHTYRSELNLIEQAINTERNELVETNNKHWESLYKQREKDEVNNLEYRFVALNEHNELMNQIMVEHQEKFRATKINLEKDIQVLQQQLEQMKAVCLLNKEKMEYNYQVLKKRDEESLLIRSQQKRRINKLQDSVTTLRRRIQTVEQATIAEEKRLRSEVVKLHRNIKDIQLKAEHFATVNNSKYNQLWKFNHECAKKLLDKILNIDRIIFEQHLGLPWTAPSITLMAKADMPSYQAAMEKIQASKNDIKCEDEGDNLETSVIDNRLMRHILKAIANSAGFLVESKLLILLKDYTEEEETLVCLDNVFCALGLKCKEDIEHLRKALEPYINCKTCGFSEGYITRDVPRQSHFVAEEHRTLIIEEDNRDEKTIVDEEDASIETRSVSDQKKSLKYSSFKESNSISSAGTLTVTIPSESFSVYGFSQEICNSFRREDSYKTTEEPVDVTSDNVSEEKSSFKTIICKNPDHIHYIEPSTVLKILKDFVDTFTQCKRRIACTLDVQDLEYPETMSRLIKHDDVKLYWERFREVFSPEKEKLWDCLMIGLSKYHSVLQERHKINKEVEQLKLQNSELRRLLQRYALPTNMKAGCLKPTREFLPPLAVKSSQDSYKSPINLFLQLNENKKTAF